MQFLLYVHVIGAAVYVGGLITLALLVPAIRKATDDRSVIQAAARRFGVISWTALGLQVTTGTLMVLNRVWTQTLILKLGLVMLSVMIAAWHQVAARDQSPKVRGAIQGIILALALAIVWLALRV